MKRAIPIAIVIILAVVSLRVVLSGRAALGEGDDWMLRGKPAEAIRSYETAARWYLPLAPHVDAAYAKLHALTGDTATGLLAWRAIRSAARATRTLWQPHAADLAEADANITRLAARDSLAGEGAGATIEAREAWHGARLSEDLRANRGATALAGLGIALLLVGGVLLVRRPKPIHWPAGVIALGTVCWLVGLYNA